MGQISNRILISSVNDGTTIHGSLRATKSLTQGWDGGSCSPSWTDQSSEFYHPVIYLTLFNGNQQIQPTTFDWYYNGLKLTFSTTPIAGTNPYEYPCTNTDYAGSIPSESWFWSSYKDPDGAQGISATQCLTLNHNLASVRNLDIDLISIKGTVEISGAQVPFEAGIDVTLTDISATGYLGVLSFQNGKSTLDGDSDSVTITASLYRNGARVADNLWKCKWSLNGGDAVEGGKSKTLTGSQVTDIATVLCYFYHNANGTTTTTDQFLQYTGMVVVDDVGDPEYLYIRYTIDSETSVNDGAPVSLHSGQKVTYKMWVGRSDDSNQVFTITKMEAQPHKANGTAMVAGDFTAVDQQGDKLSVPFANGTWASGWCNVTANTTKDNGGSVLGGVFTVHYNDVASAGANISIIVRATLA